jgi:hypothetical protein
LVRFKEPSAAEQAPPVIAKFHPVPTEPVFCPRDESVLAVSHDSTLQQKERLSSAKKTGSKAPMPEEIPPSPVASDIDKSSAAVPRQLDAPRESSWIFSSPPEIKPEKLIEAQLPPQPSERATRR